MENFSPHDRFFSTGIACGTCGKYQVSSCYARFHWLHVRRNIFTMKQLTSVHCATKTPGFSMWEIDPLANGLAVRLAPPTSSARPPPSCRRWWGSGSRGRCRWRGWPRSPSRCPSPRQSHSLPGLPQSASDQVILCKQFWDVDCRYTLTFDNCYVTLTLQQHHRLTVEASFRVTVITMCCRQSETSFCLRP